MFAFKPALITNISDTNELNIEISVGSVLVKIIFKILFLVTWYGLLLAGFLNSEYKILYPLKIQHFLFLIFLLAPFFLYRYFIRDIALLRKGNKWRINKKSDAVYQGDRFIFPVSHINHIQLQILVYEEYTSIHNCIYSPK